MKLRNRNQGILTALPYLLPSLAGMAVFSALPIAVSLCISLTGWSGMTRVSIFHGFSTFVKENFIGIKNYIDIVKDGEIWSVLGHNAYFLILYMPLMVIMSLIVALLTGSKHRGVGAIRVIYYIPVLTSWVAGALIWRWVLSTQYGPINAILEMVGIQGPAWSDAAVAASDTVDVQTQTLYRYKAK